MKNAIYNTLLEEKNYHIKGRLYHYTQVNMAYNTNRIEGSKLSEDQTRSIFETKTLIPEGEQPIHTDDIIETKNHFKAFDYMLDVAKQPLTEEIIKTFHRYIKQGTSQEELSWFQVGDYKTKQNTIGDFVKTTNPKDVPNAMQDLLSKYHCDEKKSLEDLIDFHYQFEKIHPFQDGNGRTGRLLINFELLKNNIAPIVIPKEERTKYFNYLANNDYNSLSQYFEELSISEQVRIKEFEQNIDHEATGR